MKVLTSIFWLNTKRKLNTHLNKMYRMDETFVHWCTGRKVKREQTNTLTNTNHFTLLTLEPVNIVLSIFVPFPIPTTAKTEKTALESQVCSFLIQHYSLLNTSLVRNAAFHVPLVYRGNTRKYLWCSNNISSVGKKKGLKETNELHLLLKHFNSTPGFI